MARRKHHTIYMPTILFASSLGLMALTGVVGGALASAEIFPVGYILMGIGFGGFALTIVGAIVIASLMQHFAEKKAKRPRFTGTGGFGKVTDVRIAPDADEYNLRYIITVVVNKDARPLTFSCEKRYHIGDIVEFSGTSGVPSTYKLCKHYDDD